MSTPLFINEWHLYVASSPTFGVELAGPIGTPLGGWQVAIYSPRSDAALLLTHTIPADTVMGASGVYFVDLLPVASTVSQTHSAVGLVSPTGAVVQFLTSFGGKNSVNVTQTASTPVAGPCSGVTPVYVGVGPNGEDSSGTAGSYRLTGTGTAYEEFVWAYVSTGGTLGAVNAGQTYTPATYVAPPPPPEPEPEPLPETPAVPALTARVVAFMGRTGDTALEELAANHVGVISEMVNAYVRGHGPVRNGLGLGDLDFPPDLAAVVVTATARLIANPQQLESESADGYAARGNFAGFSLAEQAVLHRYRRRAA